MNTIQLQESIIGTLVIYPERLDDVEVILEGSDFTGPMRQLFEEMQRARSFDFIYLCSKFPDHRERIHTCIGHDAEPWMLQRYCQSLKEAIGVNRIKDACKEAQSHEGSLEDLITQIETSITGLQRKDGREPVDMKTSAPRLLQEIDNQGRSGGVISGLSTGYQDLDGATDGLHPGDLVICAGRPSMGKTALAVNVGQVIAKGEGVLMFSLEMSVSQVQKRMLSAEADVFFSKIRSGKDLTDEDWARMTAASANLADLKFFIDDTPGIGLQQLQSKARRMKRKHNIQLIIVDYLQLMTLPRNESRVTALGHITRSLKNLAKELDVCLVVLSQLSRAVDSREDKRPVMSDLRESGEIEQDADVILFPFRESAYCRGCRDRIDTPDHNYKKHQQRSEIIIEKQRQGERNISVPLIWRGEFVRFDPAA